MGEEIKGLDTFLERVENLAPKQFFKFPEYIGDILDSSYDQRMGWGLEETAQYIYDVQKFEMFLKQEINRHNTKLAYIKRELNNQRGKHASGFGDKYTKWEEKVLKFEAQDSYCCKLQEVMLECEAYINEIKATAYGLSGLTDSMKNIYYAKKGRYEPS